MSLSSIVHSSHSIQSNVWTSFELVHHNSTNTPVKMSDAIHEWITRARKDPRHLFQMQDACEGAQCNPQCPEKVVLGSLSPHWPTWLQVVLLGIVILIAISSLAAKMGLWLWDVILKQQRKKFLRIPRPHFGQRSSSSVRRLNK